MMRGAGMGAALINGCVVVGTTYCGAGIDAAADGAGRLIAITPAPAIIPRAPAPAAQTRGRQDRRHLFR